MLLNWSKRQLSVSSNNGNDVVGTVVQGWRVTSTDALKGGWRTGECSAVSSHIIQEEIECCLKADLDFKNHSRNKQLLNIFLVEMLRKEGKQSHIRCLVKTRGGWKNRSKETENKCNKQKPIINMVVINLALSIITLNGSGLNTTIKWEPNSTLSTRNPL